MVLPEYIVFAGNNALPCSSVYWMRPSDEKWNRDKRMVRDPVGLRLPRRFPLVESMMLLRCNCW